MLARRAQEPLKAGGPFELTIAAKNTITFKDVLVGEVVGECIRIISPLPDGQRGIAP